MLENHNIILTGIPRSGTSLACVLLSKLPNVVALNEPMRTARFRSPEEALRKTEKFFAATRTSLLERGVATARAVDGKLADNHFTRAKGQRSKLVVKEEITFNKPLHENFTLICKHNSLFTILCKPLTEQYPVYAIIRNPLSVLASWNTLDIPTGRGEVRALDRLLPEEGRRLRRAGDVTDRQLFILDWYFSTYLSLPPARVIRYEDVVSSGGRTLATVHPAAYELAADLQNQNRSPIYDWSKLAPVAEKLLASDNACWRFYDRLAAESLLSPT